jgi:hypothetical protein
MTSPILLNQEKEAKGDLNNLKLLKDTPSKTRNLQHGKPKPSDYCFTHTAFEQNGVLYIQNACAPTWGMLRGMCSGGSS